MPDRIAVSCRTTVFLAVACYPLFARAQANYETQVYGAETLPPQTLMVELHSNFTVEGQQQTVDGVYPTYHQEHEAVELTEGVNDWSEVGFCIARLGDQHRRRHRRHAGDRPLDRESHSRPPLRLGRRSPVD